MGVKDRKKNRELAATIELGKDLFTQERGQETFEFLEDAVKRFPDDAELRLLFASIFLKFQPSRPRARRHSPNRGSRRMGARALAAALTRMLGEALGTSATTWETERPRSSRFGYRRVT
jgi:hypothetical protein